MLILICIQYLNNFNVGVIVSRSGGTMSSHHFCFVAPEGVESLEIDLSLVCLLDESLDDRNGFGRHQRHRLAGQADHVRIGYPLNNLHKS
jgi:hypothetical protein